jgi:hypothetical protein
VKIGSLVTIADAFARTGDLELYEFSTSDGAYGTKGGPKSVRKVVTVHASFVDHTIKYYATDQASNVGDPRYLIDTEEEFTGTKRVGDICAAPLANLYFQDRFLKDRYTRVAPGAPPYPSNPSTGGWVWLAKTPSDREGQGRRECHKRGIRTAQWWAFRHWS